MNLTATVRTLEGRELADAMERLVTGPASRTRFDVLTPETVAAVEAFTATDPAARGAIADRIRAAILQRDLHREGAQ